MIRVAVCNMGWVDGSSGIAQDVGMVQSLEAYTRRLPNDPVIKRPLGIAIHHTVTPNVEFATYGDKVNFVKAIDDYHYRQGWGGFGYHFIVFPDGEWFQCQPFGRGRAHVAGRNHELYGVVLAGTFTSVEPGYRQLFGVITACSYIVEQAGVELPVAGHRDWALPGWETACPGAGVMAHMQMIREGVYGMDLAELQERVDELTKAVIMLAELLVGPDDGSRVASLEQAVALLERSRAMEMRYALGLSLTQARVEALEAKLS